MPDSDLFAAISNGSASVVTDRIATFTETGIRLESGRELDADIVGLQEVDSGYRHAGGVDQLDALSRRTKMHAVAGPFELPRGAAGSQESQRVRRPRAADDEDTLQDSDAPLRTVLVILCHQATSASDVALDQRR